jgi:hypothetical protein
MPRLVTYATLLSDFAFDKSPRQIDRDEAALLFVPHVKLSARKRAWVHDEVVELVNERIAARGTGDPLPTAEAAAAQYAAAIQALEGGARLVLTISHNGNRHSLEPGAVPVSAAVAAWLKLHQNIVVVDAGLFAGSAQSWGWSATPNPR